MGNKALFTVEKQKKITVDITVNLLYNDFVRNKGALNRI